MLNRHLHRWNLGVLGLVYCLGFGPANGATTVTLQPDSSGTSNADAFVTTGPSDIYVGVNYGGAGALAVSASSAKGTFETLLRVDVSTAVATFDATYGAGQWQVDSVSLKLSSLEPNNPLFNGPNTAGQFSISWFDNDGWVEGTGGTNSATTTGIKWSEVAALTAAAESQGVFNYTGTGLAEYALNPSAGLLADILAGGPLGLYLQPADSSMSATFGSRSNASNRPALIVTASAIPEPTRVMLVLAGVLACASCRRRPGVAGSPALHPQNHCGDHAAG